MRERRENERAHASIQIKRRVINEVVGEVGVDGGVDDARSRSLSITQKGEIQNSNTRTQQETNYSLQHYYLLSQMPLTERK